jgi:two-component system, cell cycle sensor histidine kinase and response regulator CckA
MNDRKLRILVVEDETVVAMGLETDLSRLGYEVIGIADSSSEAVRQVADLQPELVLMDIKLRGPKDGIETAAAIRKQWQIPIVFLTANSNETVVARAQEVDPSGLLGKPYRTNDLNAAITLAVHQHKLRRALFAEKTWLGTMLSSLSDGVVATDTEGVVRYLSPVGERLTGWEHADAIGKPIEDVYTLETLEGQPLPECQLRRALRLRQPVERGEFLMKTRSGTRLSVEDAAAPLVDAKGKLIGAVTLFLDITERRRAEQEREALRKELQRSNEELSRFSYSLSHDLVGPARSVSALSEVLLRGKEGELNGGQRRVVELMRGAAAGMSRLVNSMLEFALTGQGTLSRERVAVARVIEHVKVQLASAIEECGAVIRCGVLPEIEADSTQMGQLFQNIVANALKYRNPEHAPIIDVSGEEHEQTWSFAVQDNGQGIPRDSLERIFDPLTRLHGQDVPGSGLGLALCRKIVERHGGRIWAESAGQGNGTTIRFVIPRKPVS